MTCKARETLIDLGAKDIRVIDGGYSFHWAAAIGARPVTGRAIWHTGEGGYWTVQFNGTPAGRVAVTVEKELEKAGPLVRARNIIERGGYIVQVWALAFRRNGFEYRIYIEGTEPEMRAYAASELGEAFRYHAITDHEYELVKELGAKVYIAPQI